MRILYFIIKFLPFWALPIMLISGEVAFIYKRRGRKDIVLKSLLVALFFFMLTVLFFVYRWDKSAMPLLNELFLSLPRSDEIP